jgi:pimeloyl-ACP methyl ester carboxylesterase
MRERERAMDISTTTRRWVTAAAASALLAGLAGVTAPAAPAVSPAAPAFTPKLTSYKCPPKTLPAGVQCARLTVPLDWQTPTDGRTTTIDVRVMRSKEGRGGFTFNPGGPGGSGIDSFPGVYSLLPDEIVSRFDFVGWDPRGVGGSGLKLKGCSLPTFLPPDIGPVEWQAFWQDAFEKAGAANAACVAANPDAAPYLGTWQVIRDLDALRAALGYSQWNYWGMSYGTRIGNVYARTFPNRLRATILDGSLPADESIYRLGTSFPVNLQVTTELYPALAAPDAARKIRIIENHLNSAVLPLPDGTKYTRWDWAEQYRTLLRSQNDYGGTRVYVDSLYTGITGKTPGERGKALKFVASISEQLRKAAKANEAIYPVLALVNCSDLHDRPTVEQLVTASQMVEGNYGVTLPVFMGNAAVCAGLDPAGLSPAVPTGPSTVALKNPPVFVLTTGDVATPWVWGRGLANTFARSSTITYDSTQHVAYLSTPSACLNDPVTEYLLTLTMPPRVLGCPFVPGGPTPVR